MCKEIGQIIGIITHKSGKNIKILYLDGSIRVGTVFSTKAGNITSLTLNEDEDFKVGDIIKCSIIKRYVTGKTYGGKYQGEGYLVRVLQLLRSDFKIDYIKEKN